LELRLTVTKILSIIAVSGSAGGVIGVDISVVVVVVHVRYTLIKCCSKSLIEPLHDHREKVEADRHNLYISIT
jgi:hypothetical protein